MFSRQGGMPAVQLAGLPIPGRRLHKNEPTAGDSVGRGVELLARNEAGDAIGRTKPGSCQIHSDLHITDSSWSWIALCISLCGVGSMRNRNYILPDMASKQRPYPFGFDQHHNY